MAATPDEGQQAPLERQWQYLGINGDKKGPFSESVVLRMLVKKLPGLEVDSFCWCPGMTDWVPIGQIEPFKSVIEARAAAWFYLDKDGAQQGPFTVKEIAGMLEEGKVDGLSLVWHAAMGTEWKALSEVEQLREVIRLLMRPEEEDDEAEGDQAGGGEGMMDENQVFQQDEIPSLPSKKKGEKEGEDAGAGEEKKSYVADDGVKYRFNSATNDWEEADSGYESDEEENDDLAGEEKKEGEVGEVKGGEGGVGSTGEKRKRKKKKKQGKEFDKESNKWVYITGLPQDITPEEMEAHFKQVGVLAVDPENQQPRIKIYRDPEGVPKGDASIAYVRPESVELAVEILNEGFIRPGFPVKVSKAVFQQKGDTFVGKKRKTAEAKIKVAKAAAKQALSWADEDDSGLNRSKALRIVVIKNMFHPRECQTPKFVEELQEDLDGECSQCGPIEKMTIFEKNPEGVVIIKYATAYAAEQCVKLMNGRFFAGRKLQSFYWDGTTDYTKAIFVDRKEIDASMAKAGEEEGKEAIAAASGGEGGVVAAVDEEEDEEKRLDEFGDYLDNQELPDEFALDVAPE